MSTPRFIAAIALSVAIGVYSLVGLSTIAAHGADQLWPAHGWINPIWPGIPTTPIPGR